MKNIKKRLMLGLVCASIFNAHTKGEKKIIRHEDPDCYSVRDSFVQNPAEFGQVLDL